MLHLLLGRLSYQNLHQSQRVDLGVTPDLSLWAPIRKHAQNNPRHRHRL